MGAGRRQSYLFRPRSAFVPGKTRQPKKAAARAPKSPAKKSPPKPKTLAKAAPRQKATKASAATSSAPGLIDARLRALPDWRGRTLARMRALILEADAGIVEEVKWVKPSNPGGVPVWSHNGILCTGEAYKDAVKLTFAHGASLPDPGGLFNASLEGKTRRAIDLHEGDEVDAAAFQDLVRAAIAFNASRAK